MNPRLRELVRPVGYVLGATGLILAAVFVPKLTATRGEAIDAGIAEGTAVEVVCDLYRPRDGGRFEHGRERMRARWFGATDELVIVERPDGRGWRIRENDNGGLRCRRLQQAEESLGPGVDFQEEPFPCACSSGVGCEWLNGHTLQWEPAPAGASFPEGQWRGAGCVRRPCTVFADGLPVDEAWPEACPQ